MADRVLTLAAWLVFVTAALLWLVPLITGTSTPANRAAAVIVLTMGLLATGALPEYVTALVFFLAAMLLTIAPPGTVFSGFASNTLWLVFGGLIVAEAVSASGLGRRLAARLVGRRTLTYPKLVTLTVAFSTALAFVMPATLGRILLLLPILTAVAEHAGLRRGSRGHNGVSLAAIMSTYQCGTAVLPANAPNLVLAGAAESIYGVRITYAEYLAVHFPVMGALKAGLIVILVCALFGERAQGTGAEDSRTPMSGAEKRLAFILAASLALWATDFLHGIQPGWVALAAGLACILPRVGVMPLAALGERVKVGPVFYIAAVLGLGATLSETGLATSLTRVLNAMFTPQPGADFTSFIALSLLSSVAGLLTTNPVQPAVLAPLAGELAAAMGWSVKTVLMTYAVGFTTLILPYQVPPVVVGLQIAGLRLRTALRLTLPLALVSLVILVPLNFVWWKLIGYVR